jgi:glycosyltransferase involved in cell wall biosynthesis
MRSRYLIDIDGWANSWGLLQKLLTGAAVLKVASQTGARQWYYDRLEPWVNYVPVRADFVDLDDAISFVLENDERAREIGEAGRRLALSLNLESEIYGMAARL